MITAAFALFLASVSALDKPLDIEVTSPAECDRKTKRGLSPLPLIPLRRPCH